ncbi:MAG: hypothetical protein QM664_09235, partial [Flavihumibacter sp.]
MNQPLQYLPVNWVDGMKINKAHFLSEQRAATWHLAATAKAFVNELNYGLLPVAGGNNSVAVLVDNQQHLLLPLRNLYAITTGGHLLYIDDATGTNSCSVSIPAPAKNAQDTRLYALLSVQPFERQPAGEPSIDESQWRPPFTEPVYALHLVNETEMTRNGNGAFYLPVARLLLRHGRMVPDEDYIIPVTCCAASPVLMEKHQQLTGFYSQLENWTLQIQQKIVQKKQQNDLAMVIMECCDKLAGYTAAEYQRGLLSYSQQPPVVLLQSVGGLCRLLRNTFDIYTGTLKDELFAYFNDWCGIVPETLETAMKHAATFTYRHYDCGEAMQVTTEAIKWLSRLFQSLAGLDYIGKKREAGIFVKEQVVSGQEEA